MRQQYTCIERKLEVSILEFNSIFFLSFNKVNISSVIIVLGTELVLGIFCLLLSVTIDTEPDKNASV